MLKSKEAAQTGNSRKLQAVSSQQQDLHFRCFAPADDPASCEAVISAVSQALVREGVVLYFTRGSIQAASLFWQELLQARFRLSPHAQQIFCLSDFSTAAVVHRYPQERATRWNLLKRGAVLKFMAAVPLGKWKALNACAIDLERQKQAFLRSHGEFWYLELIATQPQLQHRGLGSMLLHHICFRADQEQRYVYAEASSEEVRQWYRKHGFQDLMTYTLRPNAPKLLVMARPPRLLEPDPPAPVPRRAAGQGWQREQQPQPQEELEPVGVSVRTRRSTLAAH
ncbi:hypothetical protein N2152v2_007008 [Parachlorella kessleri]